MTKTNTNLEPLLVSGDIVAQMLGIGHALFHQMKSDGRFGLLPISFGRKRLYDVAELRDWVAAKCPNREAWLKVKDVKTKQT